MKAEVMQDGRWVEVDTDDVGREDLVVTRAGLGWFVSEMTYHGPGVIGWRFSRRGARRLALKKAGAWK